MLHVAIFLTLPAGAAVIGLGRMQGGGTGSYLSNIHAVAVAHVLRRPVAIYASDHDTETLGGGFFGVASHGRGRVI